MKTSVSYFCLWWLTWYVFKLFHLKFLYIYHLGFSNIYFFFTSSVSVFFQFFFFFILLHFRFSFSLFSFFLTFLLFLLILLFIFLHWFLIKHVFVFCFQFLSVCIVFPPLVILMAAALIVVSMFEQLRFSLSLCISHCRIHITSLFVRFAVLQNYFLSKAIILTSVFQPNSK